VALSAKGEAHGPSGPVFAPGRVRTRPIAVFLQFIATDGKHPHTCRCPRALSG